MCGKCAQLIRPPNGHQSENSYRLKQITIYDWLNGIKRMSYKNKPNFLDR